jgi:uncharacterized protein YdaU (DUF1376 family)
MDRATWEIPDWLAGAEELTLEAEYAYFRLCLFFYQFDGLLKDDDQANARRCKMSTRAYRQAKAQLVTACKLEVRDGYLWNAKCQKVLESVCAHSESQSARARRRWDKARENAEKSPEKAGISGSKNDENGVEKSEKPNDINVAKSTGAEAGGDAISESRKDSIPDGIESPHTPTLFGQPEPVPAGPSAERLAFDAWNRMAEQVGLPKAQKFDEARKSKIRARLKECGGLEGWACALEKVAASSLCRGERGSGWKADLDFILTASKFTKLMEGSYDDHKPAPRRSSLDKACEDMLRDLETAR